jgi:D-serine deaminase-like pyridoxal phosphate-dependent protein
MLSRRGFLTAAAAPALVVPSRSAISGAKPERMTGRDSADRPATRADIPTPALLLDLDAFEANVAKMASYLKARGKGFRPHGKTHKCPEIGLRLTRAGAVGHCAAKLSEAEAFAEHGLTGLLVTTQVIGRRKTERAVALAARQPDTTFVVDAAQAARDLDAAAAAFKGKRPVVVNVAVDLLYGRTGIAPGEPALELAKTIASLKNLTLAGIQAYDGGASHTLGFEARKARSEASMAKAVETRRAFERAGLPCSFVSCGSTGTYNIDSSLDGITELQPGSFMFMDTDYNRIGGQDGAVYQDFKNSLTVLATVVSLRAEAAIVDGGYKAFSTDRQFTPEAKALPGVTYHWAGDEHGRLDLTKAQVEVKLGDRLEFIVPHCDPSVNLYDRIHCLRGDTVEAVWPIAARGLSQ